MILVLHSATKRKCGKSDFTCNKLICTDTVQKITICVIKLCLICINYAPFEEQRAYCFAAVCLLVSQSTNSFH